MIYKKSLVFIFLPPVAILLVNILFTYLNLVDKIGYLYIPIVFSIIFSFFNFKFLRFKIKNKILKFFTTFFIVFLIVAFALVIGLLFLGLYSIFNQFIQQTLGEDDGKFVIIMLGFFIIAPIVLFVISKYLFKINSHSIFYLIMFSTVTIISMTFYKFRSIIENFEGNDENLIINPVLFWLFFMLLGLQLIFYFDE